MSQAVVAADPAGLVASGAPADEYDSEVNTIVAKIRVVQTPSVEQIRDVVFNEFERMFGHGTVGPPEAYDAVAKEIWRALEQYRSAG